MMTPIVSTRCFLNPGCMRTRQVAEPVLRGLLEDIDLYISHARGELAVIVQHAYSLAVPHAQRVIRGALERRKAPDRRWEVLNYVS